MKERLDPKSRVKKELIEEDFSKILNGAKIFVL